MTDLLIAEFGNGGDLALRGNDLVGVTGIENTPYLSMFGGASWWANYMFPQNLFSSQTETALRINPLTSAGRIAIEQAANADLAYLNNIAGTIWSVDVTIPIPNRLEMAITINGQQFIYQWNPDTLFLTYQIK